MRLRIRRVRLGAAQSDNGNAVSTETRVQSSRMRRGRYRKTANDCDERAHDLCLVTASR